MPDVAVVVCTRNRGASVVSTARSVLANDHPLTIVVIDQSDDDATESALSELLPDERLTHVRTSTVGLGRARNLGLASTGSDIVLFTDDDVTVPPDWVATMTSVFVDHPTVGVVFCNVSAADHDPNLGFVPAYERDGDVLVRTLAGKRTARGIGAGLGVRRSAIEQIGGFDELLGAGGPFSSCEDGDVAVRSLLAGWHVYETAATTVVHDGFRTWDEGKALTKRDFYGIGAAYWKPLRCRRWQILPVIGHELFVRSLWHAVRPVLRLQRPRGLRRAPYLLRGMIDGARTPVDCSTIRYVAKDA